MDFPFYVHWMEHFNVLPEERELVCWRDVCESRAGLAVLLYKLTSSRPASGMNFTPDKQHDSLSSTSLLYAGHSRRSCAVLGCLLLLLMMMMPHNSRMGLHPFCALQGQWLDSWREFCQFNCNCNGMAVQEWIQFKCLSKAKILFKICSYQGFDKTF